MAHNKYYRSIKKRIEYDTAVQDRKIDKQAKSPLVPKIDLSDIYIPQFPRRLKKGLFRGLDRRYYLILAGSIVFHIAMIIILYHNTSFDLSEEKITKIQSRIVDLILEKSEISEQARREIEEQRFSDLIQQPEPTEEDEQEAASRRRARRREERGQSDTRETKIPDAEFLSEEREAAQQARAGQRSELSAQVGSMGVLEYMKSQIITSKVDEDFLNYTARSTDNFIRMMDGMDPEDLALFKLNRSGSAGGFGFGIGGTDSVNYKARLKSRRSQPKTKAAELFGSDKATVDMESAEVEKVEEFDEAEPKLDALAKLRNRIVQRTAAELSKTIRSHNTAIQDCYKTQLRRDLGLKGKIQVRISINSQGQVTHAELVSSTLNHEKVEQCVLKRIRRWRDFGICPTQKGIFSFTQSYSFGD